MNHIRSQKRIPNDSVKCEHALVQYDRLGEKSTGLGYKIEGNGWMAGPYAEFRLSENLIFDMKGLWGKSNNEISPFMTYTEAFDTTRWLASARLTGTWTDGNWHFTPRAQLIWYQDRAEGYIDSNGIFIAGQTLTLGRAIVGPEVSYRHKMDNGGLLEPRLALKGLWTFSQSNLVSTTVAGSPAYDNIDTFRLRIEAGVKFQNKDGARLEFSGAHEGLGDNRTEITTGRIQFTMPLSMQ